MSSKSELEKLREFLEVLKKMVLGTGYLTPKKLAELLERFRL